MNSFQNLFEAQKAYFASNITLTYEWRVDQLDRMGRMIKENEAALQKAMARDFKTASQDYVTLNGDLFRVRLRGARLEHNETRAEC